jgi:spore maturation protein CgeB
MKTRMIEAASTGTIFLVKRDEWNVIEEWFSPGKDFIYWTNYNDLYEKIFDITKNFDKYNNILDSAAKKVKQFYFEGFMKKILI